jgi:hypothetical protein
MTTVKQLRELLETMPDHYEVVIYPKYSSDRVDGIHKHSFRVDNVCIQEPYAASIKHDKEKLAKYFGDVLDIECLNYDSHEVNNHVAIIF